MPNAMPNALRRCATCAGELPARRAKLSSPGQGPLYCSNACRQRAYRQRVKTGDVEPPPTYRLHSLPNDLPLSLDTFVGRKTELVTVSKLLRHGRLITIFGAAGVGKTRLALEVGSRVRRSFPAGVYLVQLAPITRPEFVVQAVAAEIGVTEQPGTPLIDTLTACLHDEELLLILDNCEHLVEACGELAVSLLRRCAGVHILATSREALRLPGELVFSNVGLPLDDAVQLFSDRAREVAPAFVLRNANRHLVELICSSLDNLPLAVELAARLVRVLPLDDIADGLRYRFELLTSGTRATDARHRDLLTAIEWSYDLLSPAEQALVRRLSILRDSYGLELVQAVAGDLELSIPACVELLASLESKSLIISAPGPQGRARFRQLESVRAYAQRRLLQAGEWDSTAECVVAWFTTAAAPLLDQFLTTGAAFDRLVAEYESLFVAVEHLADKPDPRRPLLVAALVRCRNPSRIGDYGQELLAAALQIGEAPTRFRCFALEQAAWLSARAGDYDRALLEAKTAVELAREHGSTALLCRSLIALGFATQQQGSFADAIGYFSACLDQVRNLREAQSTALCLNNLAWATVLAGDLPRATILVAEALAICDDHGEPNRVAALRHTSGLLALELNNLPDAVDQFVESLRLIGSHSSGVTPFALEGLGVAAVRAGQLMRGLRLIGAAETIRRKSGLVSDPWWSARLAAAFRHAHEMMPKNQASAALAEGRRLPIPQAVEYALHDNWAGSDRLGASGQTLTRRERQVAELVTQGLTNREISERLRMSERTVESHLGHIRTKLDLRSRAQVAAWAAKHGPFSRSPSA